uniref:Uncharacterized protein n=1 Tax=Rhizophora mucronata TaxID=61149 RepID=A0A2P2IH95_RHIMU
MPFLLFQGESLLATRYPHQRFVALANQAPAGAVAQAPIRAPCLGL